MMNDLAFRAMVFARETHRDQVRKYTGNPYADHLAEVAGIVAASGIHAGQSDSIEGREQAIAVAWLHDSMEDQAVEYWDILKTFDGVVAAGVEMLSDLEVGNRAVRKAASRIRLSTAAGWVQSIKCADLISNTSSIVMHDPKFAVTYQEEKRLLLDVMTRADPRLLAMARAQTNLGEIYD